MKTLYFGVGILLALIAAAICAPLLASHSPFAVPQGGARLAPSADHWFGTDAIGRDVFARVLYGARTSLLVGVCSAAVACLLGTVIGVWAGWHRGVRDAVASRLTDVFMVLPSILIAGSLLVAIGRSTTTMVLVIGLTGWPVIARVMRAETLRVRSTAFVQAGVVGGLSTWKILRRHVLPHIFSTLAVLATVSVGTSIIAEASLSYLGIGVVDPTPSWGLMVFAGRGTLTSAPHIIAFPSVAVVLTILAFTLISVGLRRYLDVSR